MAKTKSGGSSRLGRDSESKRLGVKVQDGEKIKAGAIIIRQRGTKYLPGLNVKLAGDDTILALKNGKVKFKSSKKTCFDGSRRYATVVNVM